MASDSIHSVDYCNSLDGATPTQVREIVQDKIVHYQAQIGRLQGHIRRLKAAHNAVSTFHVKMPTEILMHIFRQVNPSCMRDIQLTHVCRTWRNVIHHTPEFWRDIVLTLDYARINPQIMDDLLARSGSLGIGLYFDEGKYLSFLTTSPFAARLSSLKVYISFSRELAQLAQLYLPSLESLELESDDYIWIDASDASQTATHSRQFSRLNSLSLTCCPLLPAFTPRSLRHVLVSDLGLAFDNLIKCLEGCPDLQTLTLDDCWSNENEGSTQTPVDLPQLQSLKLSGISSKTPFLSCVTFPETTYVEFSIEDPEVCIPAPEWVLPASVATIACPLRRVVLNTTAKTPLQTLSLSGYLSNSQLRLLFRLENHGLDLSMNGPPESGWWFGDLRFFSFLPTWLPTTEPIRTLELHLHDETLHLSQATWMSLLQSFDSVSLLVVDMKSCREFFRALSLVAVPLSLQELEVVHQDRLDQDDHELIVRAAEHLVDIGSPLKRLAITMQAEVSITSECVPTEWPAASLERLHAVVSEVVFGNEE